MRVAIDATSVGSAVGGDETATRCLLRALHHLAGPGDQTFALFASDAEVPTGLGDAIVVDRRQRHAGPRHFAQALPHWLRTLAGRGDRPDVVISLTHAPLWSPAPVVLLVPDLSFLRVPQDYPRTTRLRLRALVGHQVKTAAAVLTVSEFSRRDLIATYGLDPAAVYAVPLSIDPAGTPDPAARNDLTGRGVRAPYLLYLGNLHPRKNVPLAITEFRAARAGDVRLSDHQFVVAGRPWFGSRAEHTAASGALVAEVLFLDRVTDAEREVLLHDAEALVYLSRFEGFGLPPLEAMTRGTPVVAADRTAIPEVCADAALLVDPDRPAMVRSALVEVLTDGQLRAELRRRGRARAAHFDTAATARALSPALDRAAGCRAPTVPAPTP